MVETLNLNVMLTPPPAGSPSDMLASVSLQFEAHGSSHSGDLLTNPLSKEEGERLRWYLEEYWEWPFEQFRERAEEIEQLLPELGKRMYQSVFGSPGAQAVVQAWRLQSATPCQISIVSGMPRVLSLPWELLHDEQGFLALRSQHPVSIVRRLSQRELPALPTPFEPPLRILLVTARPDDAGFVDPRSIARELLEEVAEQVEQGAIALEFLRPPTLPALRQRLSGAKRPAIHVLHFDGHGFFDTGKNGQGMLAFEDEHGQLDPVRAGDVSQVLQDSSVRLAVLTACQSALGAADDVFSSVAAQFIRSGVDAVIAMSASVLVVTATRYTEALYRALAAGIPAPVAQERARQALHDDPRRNVHRRQLDDEGTMVTLHDWWLPHYYQQRPVSLQSVKPARKRKKVAGTALLRLNEHASARPPRYGFSGRASELLQIERALLHKKLVVIHGFGGMGKTALAREAAEWFTRTGLYKRACFISFEQGGDATLVLSLLGTFLGIYDGSYNPSDSPTSLASIQRAVRRGSTLLIADSLESILPAGEAALEPAERARLWEMLLALRKLGVGVLLTTRDIAFAEKRLSPGKEVVHLPLRGLFAQDAYLLASRVLTDLGIDRACAPYAELRDLLAELDHHPLAIRLVLPTLREHSLATIRADFAQLLPGFVDDTTSGRNRSLLASLDYSLCRLRQEQRAYLARLALFEGGANEADLLAITQIPEAEWATLRPALEQAALLVAEQMHEAIAVPFLHFHPVLIPSLRQEAGTQEEAAEERALRRRYAQGYAAVAVNLDKEAYQYPEPMYALVRRELPNLRKALEWLVQTGDMKTASGMANALTRFLTTMGLTRERELVRRRLEQALAAVSAPVGGGLTHTEYLQELGRAEDERGSGKVQVASARLTRLLARIQALPGGAYDGPGSYVHCRTLQELGECLLAARQLRAAESKFNEALALLEALLKQEPENRTMRILRAYLLRDLGNVLADHGQYAQARTRYEQALQEHRALNDTTNEAATLGQLGTLALLQQDYPQAWSRYMQALKHFRTLRDPAWQAVAWHQLGMVAQEQQAWAKAEQCYRESLALEERFGNTAGAANTCNQLALVAEGAGRPAEAEGWYKGALERVEPDSTAHAKILSNLSNLFVEEVRAGRAARDRLIEARRCIEQARRIEEQPGLSAEIWTTYRILARLAELEEKPEAARDYRRKERESYAAFAGNRYQIDRQYADLIKAIVAAARGDAQVQAEVAAALPTLEKQGWHGNDAVQRIGQGERNWQELAEGLDNQEALLILRVLETLASPPGTPLSQEES
ncbi:MAG TPA: CHAT domain-containing protein [Ktedonobacteraceae bacterium]|jgi:tetratricopeptide (TPR) repeat protein